MNLELERKFFSEFTTIGDLYLNNRWECCTLEDVDRKLENDEQKIQGQTAIPRGIYIITIDWSNRFKRLMPHILDVPQFEGVRIHCGNTHLQTEGCILIGIASDQDSTKIIASQLAFNSLFEKLIKTFEQKEIIKINII